MPEAAQRQKRALLEKLAKMAEGAKPKKKPGGADGSVFRHYFSNVPTRDILEQAPEDLLALSLEHLAFANSRKGRKPLIRLRNVRNDEGSGWDAGHTVIEIINDDMPFLVDSVSAELNRRGIAIHIAIHPVFNVTRDKDGALKTVSPPGAEVPGKARKGRTESWLHLAVTEQPASELKELEKSLIGVLKDVKVAVDDWLAMRAQMQEVIEGLRQPPVGCASEEAMEVREFLQWVHDNNFTFLGCRESELAGSGAKIHTTGKRSGGLGILRDPKRTMVSQMRDLGNMPEEVRSFVSKPDILLVTKANEFSTVHRSVPLDYIVVKQIDSKGKVVGQHIFVGLFTSAAYNRSPSDIPLLRRKVQRTLERAGFDRLSHDGKALLNILETYPRDELLQSSEDSLFLTALGILHLQDRQRTALFVRRDDFERFVSCLVYIPRDQFTTELRHKLTRILEEGFNGSCRNFYTLLGDQALARLHVIVETEPGSIPEVDVKALEAQLAQAAQSWSDQLLSALIGEHGEQAGIKLSRRYGEAFPAGYQANFDADTALDDIDVLEETLATDTLGMHLYRPDGAPLNTVKFKVYHPEQAIPLSDVLPMLEHLGLRVIDETPHKIRPVNGSDTLVMIHDFGLTTRDGSAVDIPAVRDQFHEVFRRVWFGEMESDGFNALVLLAGLTWRDVIVLRAYCKYLRQAGITFSEDYMQQTLANNPALATLIVALFRLRFDPKNKRAYAEESDAMEKGIEQALDAVSSADEDRIIRRFVNLVQSTLRTNFFQTAEKGLPKPYVSFKLASAEIDDLPLPRPLREIFVYSPRIEGVHLRFGFVARGGLRWSDRREDFRTEILGLVKAQQVKNAVIVPVGSKGGFVVKKPPLEGGREAFMAEGIECYKTFISGLLDITDNLVGPKLVPPKKVVRHDDDDPYLVVAADKGTATFSDIANGVSEAYGFWLGDAFASGGSAGYDHKKMGITARGAWESVKRHFREIGIDTQSQDFTCVGVGDMSGDVFGNGMLLSKHIRLKAAFNHLHIFVDPEPDAAKTWDERKRLFDLPRSSWADFNPKLISKGGQIYDRSAKSLKMTPEIKKAFGISKDNLTPNELIKTLLASEVDLLWFGGIGTYIKHEDESHAEAGDRSNDAVRINGGEVRARVIGEGANLGVTQMGRIEFALTGGRLNTDAIDNSAGVDCSDHEVNIKILVDGQVKAGVIEPKKRNGLLAKMTDEVGELCLEDNYRQTQAITIAQSLGTAGIDDHQRLMRFLERGGLLNRDVEFLPDDETIAERTGRGQSLTRPELAVLLSYAKNWLYAELLHSDLPDDSYLEQALIRYFPTDLRKKFGMGIAEHRLRREIIATVVSNLIVNRMGETFVTRFMEKTGLSPVAITKAFVIAAEVFDLETLWDSVDALDNKTPAAVQTAMLRDIQHLMDWGTLWFLRNGKSGLALGDHVDRFRKGVADLSAGLTEALPAHYVEDIKSRAKPYTEQGVDENLGLRISGLVNLYSACDVVRLATKRDRPVAEAAAFYFAAGTRFRMGRLRAAADSLDAASHWQRLAVDALIEEIYGHQLALSDQVLATAPKKASVADALQAWLDDHHMAVEQTEALLNDLWSTAVSDLSMVAVASRQLRALASQGAD
ncbi:MAG: NAD-glutamate dehydrogenase [Magnetovibrionaceae bacterium]